MKISSEPWGAEYSPFTSQDGTEIPAFRIYDGEGELVCETDENGPRELQEANARLIQAAPDLLRALRAAARALNTAVCFRVDDRTSYDIAAEIGRVLHSIEHGGKIPRERCIDGWDVAVLQGVTL